MCQSNILLIMRSRFLRIQDKVFFSESQSGSCKTADQHTDSGFQTKDSFDDTEFTQLVQTAF